MNIFLKIRRKFYSEQDKEYYKRRCVSKVAGEAESYIKEKYKDCSISNVVYSGYGSFSVFYNYDKDVKDNEESGISEKIKKDFYKIVKHHDVLEFITEEDKFVFFDSKENLDKNYDGNLYYYYK